MQTIDERKLERKLRLYEIPLIIGLVITWMALWRELSWMTLISGFIVAFTMMRIFYLPPVELAGRINIFYIIRYTGFFFWNVMVASFQVAWIAIRPKKVPDRAIVAIELKSNSDFILTVTGLTISLIPGSFIVDVDREETTLFLHVLDAEHEESVVKMRETVGHIEMLLTRALGIEQEQR